MNWVTKKEEKKSKSTEEARNPFDFDAFLIQQYSCWFRQKFVLETQGNVRRRVRVKRKSKNKSLDMRQDVWLEVPWPEVGVSHACLSHVVKKNVRGKEQFYRKKKTKWSRNWVCDSLSLFPFESKADKGMFMMFGLTTIFSLSFLLLPLRVKYMKSSHSWLSLGWNRCFAFATWEISRKVSVEVISRDWITNDQLCLGKN